MCAVSMIGDDYRDRFRKRGWPHNPWEFSPSTPITPHVPYTPHPAVDKVVPAPRSPTQADFDELKKEVEQMREELRKAKAQDIAEGNPDCEMEDKVALLKQVAEAVGVSLEDIFPFRVGFVFHQSIKPNA